jgi:hypothetical protein
MQMGVVKVELQAFLTSTVGGGEWILTPRKELAVSIEKEAGWAPALFWAVWRRGFFFTLPGLEPRIVYLLRYPRPHFCLV